MNRISYYISALILLFIITSCQNENLGPLPILGNHKFDGKDTIHHAIPDFVFVDQNNNAITNESLKPYIYVSDFFFMSCPSICPKVKKQMLRVHDKYKTNDKVKLVSHTIDPKRDTPDKMKIYAQNLGVSHDKWLFLHGTKDSLLDMAEYYFVAAYEDEDAPGGFDHSGKIILVDSKRHIRAFCDGTDPESVDGFLLDVDRLLAEYAVE